MIPIVLKVYDGGKLKHSRAFSAERIRLGSASADLVLDSASVSPSHAIIEAGVAGAGPRAPGPPPPLLHRQPVNPAPPRPRGPVSLRGPGHLGRDPKSAAPQPPEK